MEVVLKKSLPSLGKKGEVVEVKPGYARNFLIPRSMALPASPQNVRVIQNDIAQNQKAEKEILKKLKTMGEQIGRLKIEIAARVDESGALYGSVGKKEIQEALARKISLKVPKTKIDLVEPIKKIGEYIITLKLDSKIKTKFHLNIVAVKQTKKQQK